MASAQEQTPAAPATIVEPAKITLHWLEQSRAQRILWLIEELNVPCDIKIYRRDPKTHLAGDDLKKIHPLGKSPLISVVVPDSTEPLVVAESANICEYLLKHFGHGSTLTPKQWKKEMDEGTLGTETDEWLRYRYFMHYAEGSLMPWLILGFVVSQIRTAPVPFFIKPITKKISAGILNAFVTPNITSTFGFLEQQLATSPGGGKYLCGTQLSAADILISFPLIAASGPSSATMTGMTKDKYPKLLAYVEALQQEPGYKKAVDKIISIDGKYEASF